MLGFGFGFRSRGSAALAVLVVGAAALAVAPEARAQDAPSKKIDLFFSDTPVQEVIGFIRHRTGQSIEVADGVVARVTIVASGIGWRKALDRIAARAKLELDETSKSGTIVVRQPQLLSLAFSDADLRAVLEVVAAYSGRSFVLGEDVEGKVTVTLDDVSWQRALAAIVEAAGDDLVVLDDEPDVLRVLSRKALADRVTTETFALRWLKPADGSWARAQIDAAVAKDAGGKADFDESSSSLVVRASPPVLREIERLLARLDAEPTPVSVAVRLAAVPDDVMTRIRELAGALPGAVDAKTVAAVIGIVRTDDRCRWVEAAPLGAVDNHRAESALGQPFVDGGGEGGLGLTVAPHVVDGSDRLLLGLQTRLGAGGATSHELIVATGRTAVLSGLRVRGDGTLAPAGASGDDLLHVILLITPTVRSED